MQIMPGPDFPTGGIILGRGGIRAGLSSTGRGSILMRGQGHASRRCAGEREAIIVTEIPYQVNKARMIEQMAEAGARQDASKASPTSATSAIATACAW